jgi:hypothetical protein
MVFGLRLIGRLLSVELSADVVKFGALEDGPVTVASNPRFGDRME